MNGTHGERILATWPTTGRKASRPERGTADPGSAEGERDTVELDLPEGNESERQG